MNYKTYKRSVMEFCLEARFFSGVKEIGRCRMFKKIFRHTQDKIKGQGITEFAIVLPVVLMLTFGVIEFGYLLFSYSTVNSASREAARYGIAVGDVDADTQRYYDCAGIKAAGVGLGQFVGMTTGDINITYDSGPDTSPEYNTCEELAAAVASDTDTIDFGDRIVVTVTHTYQPLVSYMGLNLPSFTMTSTSSRTIVKDAVILEGGGNPGGGGGGGGGSGTCWILFLTHDGSGLDPVASPANSTDCSTGQYTSGETISVTAFPNPNWEVDSWIGTDDNGSTATSNTITMPAGNLVASVIYIPTLTTCYTLTPSHSGSGTNPLATPANSTGCSAGDYVEGEAISLSATPEPGWEITGWGGTSNDTSTAATNSLLMPASPHSVSVTYEAVAPTCYPLSLSRTGSGTVPSASPGNSLGCSAGEYIQSEVINLTAIPDSGYEIESWSGTNDDASTNTTNTVTMPGASHSASVTYIVSSLIAAPENPSASFSWNPAQQVCKNVDFSFTANGAWSTNPGASPSGYKMYKNGIYFTKITSTTWALNATVPAGEIVTFGVKAEFALGQFSQTLEARFWCTNGNLVLVGSLVRE